MALTPLPSLGDTNWYAWADDIDGVANAVDNRSIPYVPKWTANTAVLGGDVWMSPDGQIIQRNADGTTRASYDATEIAAWTVTTSGGGGVPTSRNISTTAPLTGGGTLAADLTLAVSASSTTASGVVELATSAETQTGTDTVRAVTPAGLQSKTASSTVIGLVELADNTETQTGTDSTRAVTPAGLQSKTASETASGIVELATAAETTTGTDNTRAVHPAGLKVELDKKAPLRATRTTQTGTTYTFVAADANTLVEGNNASAQTFTVPNSVFTAEDTILVRQYGAGQITIAAGAGTTARSRGNALKLLGQYSEATITFRTASEFVVSGDITT